MLYALKASILSLNTYIFSESKGKLFKAAWIRRLSAILGVILSLICRFESVLCAKRVSLTSKESAITRFMKGVEK